MRFQLIDRIDAIEPEKYIRARKLTSLRESYWRDDGRGPEMPAPLVLEALCQAGAWLIMGSTELTRRAVLMSVDDVTFLRAARPGDVLVLEGFVETIDREKAALSGTATVDGRVVLRAETILCALVPTEDLDAIASVRQDWNRLMSGTVLS